VAALRERGWTPSLILRLLGEPDELRRNPYYRKAAPMRLYAADRVEAIEQTPVFLEARQQAARWIEGAKKAAETRRATLMRQIAEMTVSVEALPLPVVRRHALSVFNNRTEQDPASETSGVFLERVTVNYIRHRLTTYDRHLEAEAGRVSIREAGYAIRKRVYVEIAAVYPALAAECQRQLRAR
jgi:hypothetical protein